MSQEIPIFAGLQTLIARSRPQNQTLFSVIDDTETMENALKIIQEVCGRFDDPATGIAMTIPVNRVVGLAPELYRARRVKTLLAALALTVLSLVGARLAFPARQSSVGCPSLPFLRLSLRRFRLPARAARVRTVDTGRAVWPGRVRWPSDSAGSDSCSGLQFDRRYAQDLPAVGTRAGCYRGRDFVGSCLSSSAVSRCLRPVCGQARRLRSC